MMQVLIRATRPRTRKFQCGGRPPRHHLPSCVRQTQSTVAALGGPLGKIEMSAKISAEFCRKFFPLSKVESAVASGWSVASCHCAVRVRNELKKQWSATTGRVCRTNASHEKLAGHTRGEKQCRGTAAAANALAMRLKRKRVYLHA